MNSDVVDPPPAPPAVADGASTPPIGSSRWDDGDPLLGGALSRLADTPAFGPAVRALAGNMLALYESDAAVAGVFKDAGRYVAAMVAASMRSGGVTLARLKDVCESFGMMSRGRAYALLTYLRYLGYVDLWAERSPRPRVYRLSPAFVQAWRAHLLAALEAAALIDPLANAVGARLHDPHWLDRFTDAQMRGLRESLPALAEMPAVAGIFLDRHAGSPILWWLIVESRWQPDASLPVTATRGELATRFGVSRMHVSRLIGAAEAAGLLTQPAANRLALTPLAHAQIARLYGMQLARLLVSCERTLAAPPDAHVSTDIAPRVSGRCSPVAAR